MDGFLKFIGFILICVVLAIVAFVAGYQIYMNHFSVSDELLVMNQVVQSVNEFI